MFKLVSVFALVAGLQALPAMADTHCGDSSPATYRALPTDRSNTTQLEASRSMPAAVTTLEVNMCAGDLKIESAPRGGKLTVRITSPGADRSLGEYLHDFDAKGGTARVDVRVPNNYHATVTLVVPMTGAGTSHINLGAGNLALQASALTLGDRELNVGAGSATLMLHGKHDYANLKVNVGMGHFEDQRPGGEKANFVIARELSGTGKGEIQLNVGAGKVLLTSEPE